MLALEGAAARGGDLIGVDLLPDGKAAGSCRAERRGRMDARVLARSDPFVAAAWDLRALRSAARWAAAPGTVLPRPLRVAETPATLPA
jgi:hypothetical protein